MIIDHIGFDIDGTLTDEVSFCVETFLQRYYETYGKKYSGLIDTSKYNLKERFPDCDKEFLDAFEIFYWAKYLREVPFRPNVKELFTKLKQMGVTIHIVTARTPMNGSTQEELEKITKERFEESGIPVDEWHIGFDQKEAIVSGNGIQLLVEDSPEQATNVSEKIPVFIFNTSYNTNVRGKNIWRIYSYEPSYFIDEVKYAREHEDNWDVEYSFEESADDKGSGIDFTISESGIVCFNPKNLTTKNICFVIPFGNDKDSSFAQKLKEKLKRPTIVRLDLIEEKPENIDEEENELLCKVMRKCNRSKIDLTNPNATNAYEMKCKIMEELLKEASIRKAQNFVFFGVQSMMLKRDTTEKYKENTIFLTGASKKDHDTIVHNKYRTDYNPWILMEDLTDVATQVRKWKIIAGTAPNELPNYINRQTTTSEGIDIVRLLPDEKPYNVQELEAKLSMDTFLLGDCHLSTKDEAKTRRIIAAINNTVGANDTILFLGDFDGKKGTGSKELTKNFLKQLRCKNVYLILGNNDPYTIKEYVEIGFRSVTDMVTYQESPNRKVILTHCPYPVNRDEVNIHGHIHGSRCYWNMDWKQHYDVWDENFVPIKIRKCLEILDNDEYVAHSENHLIY